MASSRVIASNSTANSDLARQPPLYTLPPVGAAAAGGGVLHHQGKSLGSMNMDELLRNIYGENSDAEISPFDGEAGGDFQEDGVGGGDGQVECVETKLADEVWKEIARDRKMDGSVGGPEMTLEDYLARAGVVGQDEVGAVPAMVPQPPVEGLVMDNFLRDPFAQSQPPQQQPDSSFLGFGNGVEGGGRGKRRAVQEPADKIAQQRQRRMIKNRESAARSRERKQAYTVELESLVTQLEEENSRLKRQQEEQKKERLKQPGELAPPEIKARTLVQSKPNLADDKLQSYFQGKGIDLSPTHSHHSAMETAVSFRLQCTLVLLLQLAFLFQAPFANVIVVDGLVPELKTLAVILGDTMVFKHKNLHVLYIFHSRRDFATCNFNQATLLHSGNLTTSFTWRPSRPGNYYFSFSNSTVGVCKKEWRIKIRVLPSQQSPGLPPIPAPSPTPGGNLHPPLPHDLALASPSPASEPFLPLPDVTPPPSLPIPPVFPGSVGQIPFISSNPAIPIPTGETGDSATVRPLPATGDGNKVAGIGLKRIQMRTLLFLMMALFAF